MDLSIGEKLSFCKNICWLAVIPIKPRVFRLIFLRKSYMNLAFADMEIRGAHMTAFGILWYLRTSYDILCHLVLSCVKWYNLMASHVPPITSITSYNGYCKTFKLFGDPWLTPWLTIAIPRGAFANKNFKKIPVHPYLYHIIEQPSG